ncbi:hypothetical protein [Thiohalobacter thiocyanaticus]|nr:hypothetical protein [Thiohalobacter thiocyanaticus]
MIMKLIQKRFLKGIREFEIVDDAINVRIRTLFNKEKSTVSLTTLNPEPVVNRQYLEFHGRGKNEPLVSLFLDNPSPEEFNAFVETLKQRVLEEYGASGGIDGSHPAGLGGNVHHEPPEGDTSVQIRLRGNAEFVNVARIEDAIRMLETYLAAEDIKPFLSALEALKAEPENEARLAQVVSAFNDLGPLQGAVLTYAPYISILLSDDPFQ